ncbi:PD-(D/E)XK nuclease family protein [Alloscardovia criceti]|uniref:PD-(D/E)XK nuclease family protein n=1 Tax=Alloscardovia criceti TaxID=356828 RepID=UPI0003771C26|nr:PD-(D/E)XK nuclease family protein [Alloscardovia criceti]
MAKISLEQAYEQIVQSFADDTQETETSGHAHNWLVTGAPRSGKTTLAQQVTVAAVQRFGSTNVSLAVSNRMTADDANRQIIKALKVSGQRRLATTLSAIAFRILDERQMLLGAPAPKLINGAEQTALLRVIFDRHISHARTGDLCETCMLLRTYFEGVPSESDVHNNTSDNQAGGARDTLSLFESYLTPVFMLQLRDMLARMNELGASHTYEEALVAALKNSEDKYKQLHAREHGAIQIRLSFVLRKEYAQEVLAQYPRELRLDSSRLLREAATTFSSGQAREIGLHYPRVLVVDDAQELTLAAMFLLQELHKYGTQIIFIGNPDESVLGFRGADGDFLWHRAAQPAPAGDTHTSNMFLAPDFAYFHAERLDLVSGFELSQMNYREIAASRVALNIPAAYDTDIALPERAQKFPDTVRSMAEIYAPRGDVSNDNSVDAHIFQSSRDEMEWIVTDIMAHRVEQQQSWDAMAIITHDNSTARLFGQRLQNEGIPVRFSAISKPLSEDPVALGLFAAIELGRIRPENFDTLDALTQRVSALLRQFASSPLGMTEDNHPLRVNHIEALLNALSAVIQAWGDGRADTDYDFQSIIEAWSYVREQLGAAAGMYPLNASALKTLVFLDVEGVRPRIMDVLSAMDARQSSDVAALRKLLSMMDASAETAASEGDKNIIAILWATWKAAHVSDDWQKKALDYSDISARLHYNDWLDGAMRLFDFANQNNAALSIDAFMMRVANLEVLADSLAHVAPIEEAVTVTTVASTAGQTWDQVWIPQMQQSIWPNLAVRNTLLGADDLSDVVLHGAITMDAHARMLDVLHAEKRSFLVALTRAQQRLHISAVWDNTTTPSDFLYTYMPEKFARVDSLEKADFTEVPVVDLQSSTDSQDGSKDGSQDSQSTSSKHMSMTDIIRQARVTLSEELLAAGGEHIQPDADNLSPRAQDALKTLDFLSTQGYSFAAPEKWAFISAPSADVDNFKEEKDSNAQPVRVSPSSVESIWGCPICYRLENQFSGTRQSTAATSFGDLIHEVAQWASQDMHFDTEEFYQAKLEELSNPPAVLNWVTNALLKQYNSLKSTANLDAGLKEYMSQVKNDAKAPEILGNIAYYFVNSHSSELAPDADWHPPFVPVTSAEVEKEFDAFITLEDIRFAYNAIEGRTPLTQKEFSALVCMLVNGMPEGYDYNTVVHLHGKIDRVEKHGQVGGKDVVYIIDYKTGNKAHAMSEIVSNLQLTSYQLGLIFHGKKHDTDAERAELFAQAPQITMSALFDVKHENIPATSRHKGFHKYQPALFVEGHLGYESATRSYYKQHSKLWSKDDFTFDKSYLGSLSPQALERVQEEYRMRDADRTLYSLALIARVFYAAAALKSDVITATEVHSTHDVRYCAYTDVCALCAGKNNSVMEEWLS